MRRIRWSLVGALLCALACDDPWVADRQSAERPIGSTPASQDEVGPFPKVGLFTVATPGQTGPAGIADDPAIWVHPTDASLSLIIGTNKTSSGGLHVFDLQGVQRQFVAGGRHNNVDVRYGFELQGVPVDLAAACDRNNDQIDVYVVDAGTRLLRPVGSIQTGVDVYGFAMYHSQQTDRYYAIVSSDTRVEQWELVPRVDGTVGGILARSYSTSNLIEGMVADDELGYLYMAEEATGIYKYEAEPGRPTTRLATLDVVGSTSQLVADIEGLTLYYRRDGRGYLIASSQGNDRFIVYRREGANPYLGTFNLSQVSDTDGIDVSNVPLGSVYSNGLFVAQDSDDNFRMARWQDIANALGLAVDTDGYDPRGSVDCTTARTVTLSGPATMLEVGASVQWQAVVLDTAGVTLAGCPVGWSSSDPQVATVSIGGLVLGIAPGSAVLAATVESAHAETTITVVAPVNHPPTVQISPISSVYEGATVAITASFTDHASDTHTATIDWGDGSTGPGTVNPVSRTATGTHVFASDGTYTITVRVTDNHGATGEVSRAVVVTDRPAVLCYVAFGNGATAGGTTFANEDILAFDGSQLSVYFDGSDVGLSSFTIDAFQVTSPTQLLLSFTSSGTVGGVSMDDSDVLRFTATSLGAQTAGTFSMYFDASDVGLSSSSEDVDAVELLPDGRLLLSTLGSFSVTGAAGAAEDLVAFWPTTLGGTTAGTFAVYFDGSDVGLSSSSENLDGLAVDAAGRILLSTTGSFVVNGVTGADEDVFVFTPITIGSTTTGTFSPALFFDGSVIGLSANDLVGIDLP